MTESKGRHSDQRPVVVGVDSSDRARAAALWAAAEAALREVELHLVHSSPPTPSTRVDVPSPRGSAAPAAQCLLHDIGAACERAAPGLTVRTHLEVVPGATALLGASGKAQLVVVGHHGVGGFTGTMVGSVCAALAERGHCPVVVVRTHDSTVPRHSGPVVLGLTGSRGDDSAIDFAFATAERARCPLTAVRTWWTDLDEDLLGELSGFDVEARLARTRDEASHALAPAQQEHPGVATTLRLVHDRAVPALLDQTQRDCAQLLVLAANDRDMPHMLGPTTRTLLHQADCPVAIVAPAPRTSTVVTARELSENRRG